MNLTANYLANLARLLARQVTGGVHRCRGWAFVVLAQGGEPNPTWAEAMSTTTGFFVRNGQQILKAFER
ncbi:MAG: hypothetical protein ABGX16_20410 [Pirellulales bacterium]